MISRKKMLKLLGSIPLAGSMAFSQMLGHDSIKKAPSIPTPNIFDELGIEPLINARGTMTYLSGSLMRPEVMRAINSTSHQFANLHEVIDKVGERIAELLNCEAAMVTAGAASAMTLGTAAAITGTDEKKIQKLPNLPGPRPEVIMLKSHRYVFDHAVRLAGVKIIEVEGAREMEEAINDQTVMALYFNAASSWGKDQGSVSRKEFVQIGKRNNVPTFNDAAADVPPKENLFKYQEMGFDLVAFSGGKMIRGPQSTGILLGRKDLIEAAKLNFDPYECPIGRPQKVNKEEVFGMYVALRSYLERDHGKEWQMWLDRIQRIKEVVEEVPGVTGKKTVNPGPANAFPGLNISWDQDQINVTPSEVSDILQKGSPRIEVGGGKNALHIAVVTLKSTQVDIVAKRIQKVLKGHLV